MAQQSKRKLEHYLHAQASSSSSSAAMSRYNTAGANRDKNEYYDSRYPPAMPSPETQELYNKWRQQQELDAHLGEQAEQDEGHDGLLSPRPPSAVSMSRSASYASTSYSVTGEMNNMDLGEDESGKKKQGRHGPLAAANKARTALLRKIKACDSCRKRKVKCNHYNFCLFEDGYQASKRRIRQPLPQLARQDNPESQTQQQVLLGVGGHHDLSFLSPNPVVFGEASPGQGEPTPYCDTLDLVSPTEPSLSPSLTSPLYNFRSTTSGYQSMSAPDDSYISMDSMNSMPAINSSYGYELSFGPTMPPATAPPRYARTTATGYVERHAPIGRQIAPGHILPAEYFNNSYNQTYTTRAEGGETEWECLWGDDGTASSYSYQYSNLSDNETQYACKRRCRSLENLKAHFQRDHAPFENGAIYLYCTLHGQHYGDFLLPNCYQCANDSDSGLYGTVGNVVHYQAAGNSSSTGTVDQFQQQWYFGDILPVTKHDNGPRRTERVRAEDGGFEGMPGFLTRSGTVTQSMWANSTSYVGGYEGAGEGGWTGYQGSGARGNSTFPGGEYSWPMPPDMSPGSPGGNDGNSGHRYGDIRVNLALSPPPPSSKIVPLAPLLSKLLLPPTAKTTHMTFTHDEDDDDKPYYPTAVGIDSDASLKPTRETSRSCPYSAYSKELFRGRRSRSLKRSTASGGHSRSPISLSSSLRWPSTGNGSITNILVDFSSPCQSASNLNSTFLRLLILTLAMVLLTHGLSLSSSISTSSARATALSNGRITSQVPWSNKNFLPLLFPSSLPSNSATQIAERSIMCILVGLVGMWLVKRTVSVRRVLLAADKDGLRSRRQLYQSEQNRCFRHHIRTPDENINPGYHHRAGQPYSDLPIGIDTHSPPSAVSCSHGLNGHHLPSHAHAQAIAAAA